jgi:hypothetical protein
MIIFQVPSPTPEDYQTSFDPNDIDFMNTKEKRQKDKQRSTKHTHKTKDRVTRFPLKIGGELRYSGRVSSSCSTSGTRRVNLVTTPEINHGWGKDREVFTTSGTYPWLYDLPLVSPNSSYSRNESRALRFY